MMIVWLARTAAVAFVSPALKALSNFVMVARTAALSDETDGCAANGTAARAGVNTRLTVCTSFFCNELIGAGATIHFYSATAERIFEAILGRRHAQITIRRKVCLIPQLSINFAPKTFIASAKLLSQIASAGKLAC